MKRAGRKRKGGKRHPSGQLVAVKGEDLRTRTSRQPHRRKVKADDRFDERAESAVGRMFLRGQINNDAYDAGARYAFVVGEYRATIGAPRTTSGSGRGFGCDGMCSDRRKLALEEVDCKCERRRSRYDGAYEALHDAGRAALMAVNRVVVQGADPTAEEIVYLVAGLNALARHFGLTRQPARRHYENTN